MNTAISEKIDIDNSYIDRIVEINDRRYAPSKRYLRAGADGALYQSNDAYLPDDQWEKCKEIPTA